MLASLRTFLLSRAPITSLVGSSGVYVQRADSRAVHDIIAGSSAQRAWIILTGMAHEAFDDLQSAGATLRRLQLDLDAKAMTGPLAESILDAVFNELDGYRGPAGDHTIEAVNWLGQGWDLETPDAGSDVTVWVRTWDLEILYR